MPRNNVLNPDNNNNSTNNNNILEEEQTSSTTNSNDARVTSKSPLSVFHYSSTNHFYQTEETHKKALTITFNFITSIINRVWSDEEIAIYKEKYEALVRIENSRVIIPNDIYTSLEKSLSSFQNKSVTKVLTHQAKFVLVSDIYVHFPDPCVNVPNLLGQMNRYNKLGDGFLVKMAIATKKSENGIIQTFSNLPVIITSSEVFKNWCQILKKDSSELLHGSLQEAGFETVALLERKHINKPKRSKKPIDENGNDKRRKICREANINDQQNEIKNLGFLGDYYFDQNYGVYFSIGKSTNFKRLVASTYEYNLMLKDLIPENNLEHAKLIAHKEANKLQLTKEAMGIILKYSNKTEPREAYFEWQFSKHKDGNYLYLPPWGNYGRTLVKLAKRVTQNKIFFSTKSLTIRKDDEIYVKAAIRITKEGLEKWKEIIQDNPKIVPLETQAQQRGYIILEDKENDQKNDSDSDISDENSENDDNITPAPRIRNQESTISKAPPNNSAPSSVENPSIVLNNTRPQNCEQFRQPSQNSNYYTQPSSTISINNININPHESSNRQTPIPSPVAFNPTTFTNPPYDFLSSPQFYVQTNSNTNYPFASLTDSQNFNSYPHVNTTKGYENTFANTVNPLSYGIGQNFTYPLNQTYSVDGQSHIGFNIPSSTNNLLWSNASSINTSSNLTNNNNVSSFARIQQQLGTAHQNNVQQLPLLGSNNYFSAPLPLFTQRQGFFPTSQRNPVSTNLTSLQVSNQYNADTNSGNTLPPNFGNTNH